MKDLFIFSVIILFTTHISVESFIVGNRLVPCKDNPLLRWKRSTSSLDSSSITYVSPTTKTKTSLATIPRTSNSTIKNDKEGRGFDPHLHQTPTVSSDFDWSQNGHNVPMFVSELSQLGGGRFMSLIDRAIVRAPWNFLVAKLFRLVSVFFVDSYLVQLFGVKFESLS